MADRQRVYERFAECYGAARPADLVKLFNLNSSTISNWKTGKRPIPRSRLKEAVDKYHLNWDWLLEGKLPKTRSTRHHDDGDPLNYQCITQRFLDLFGETSQTEIAAMLGVTPVTVHYMYEGKMNVSWDMMKYAINNFETTWEWLLEGRGPQKKAPQKRGAKK